MNLAKLFNFKYLKQNLKKSKGLFTVLIFIIPVITALILITKNSSEYISCTYQSLVTSGNIIGMYIIPVVISYLLYGYVYKKNSVDFVNSMPLTRSTIFITNFIGGVLIIFLMQALTAITTAISALTLPNIYIAPAMIMDIFIVMFLSYIFVFAATSLAMTVSGNVLTQIVVTLLIVFLVPFICVFGVANIEGTVNLQLENNVIKLNESIENSYTLPSRIFTMYMYGNDIFFDKNILIKTLGLIALYFAVGLYLFNKRKMENVETSFSKLWVHLFVKAITLVPMVFFIEYVEIEGIFLGITITLIFIYYCLYDFITNKKVSFKFTIPAFILSFFIVLGIYQGVNYAGKKTFQRNISIDEIKGIAFETEFTGISNFSQNKEFNIYIEDKEQIYNICNGLYDMNDEVYYKYYSDYIYEHFKIKLKNGKEIYISGTIDSQVYSEALNYLLGKEENLKKYDEYYRLGEDTYIIANDEFLSQEDTKVLINLYNNLDVKKLLQEEINFAIGKNNVPQPSFNVYNYRNHKLIQFTLNPFLSEELFMKMNEIIKKQVNETLKYYEQDIEEKNLFFSINERRVDLYYDNSFNYIPFAETDALYEYVKEHISDEIDMNDTFYVLNINCSNGKSAYIYLKETDELDFIIERDRFYDSVGVVEPYYEGFEDEDFFEEDIELYQ